MALRKELLTFGKQLQRRVEESALMAQVPSPLHAGRWLWGILWGPSGVKESMAGES
jgi:hypothetical protein